MGESVLAADRLAVGYGPIRAVRGCSFAIGAGETVAIVGANGAGKTTIMRALSNLLPRQGGSVRFLGADTAGMPAHALSRAGMLHLPEGRGIAGRLSVLDNLRLAYDARACAATFDDGLAAAYRRFPRLEARARQRAGSMSGGEQQMLALAKAVVNPPKLLLVDEPSLGLAPIMVREAFAVLAEFQRAGMAILLVEQNVRGALALAHRAYVLRQGEIVLEGDGPALLAREGELRAHLVARGGRGVPGQRS
ncbi:MAG: ABC transporter ATP-binding protein [Rhodospirillales bacterium]